MRHGIVLAAALLILAAALPAIAGDEGAVVVKVGHGEVNWTGKTITVTGSGAPNLSKGAITPAQVRLGTERAAEADAYRKVLEIVKGVHVDSQTTVGAQMQASPEVKTRVEGVIKGMKRIDTKYYADGGVDVIVQVTLDGPVTEAVVKPPEKKAEQAAAAPAPGAPSFTGIVVDARGLKLIPALAPRIVDEAGKEVYGPGAIEPEVLKTSGMVAYFLSLDSAKKNAKVTDNPVVVKAVKLLENGKCDLVLGKDDAAKVAGAPVLKRGRVVVVVD